jgi:hypothetical protein
LYEAYRQKTAAGHYDARKLQEPQLTGLLEEWGFNDDAESHADDMIKS